MTGKIGINVIAARLISLANLTGNLDVPSRDLSESSIKGSNAKNAGRITDAIPTRNAQIIQVDFVSDIQFLDVVIDHHAHSIQTVI